MLARIQKAMKKRDDEGFTLIELLVVMIIIGILVAIAVPIFLNQKNKAHETAIKSDVKQLGTNMETALTDGSIDTVALAANGTDAYKMTYNVAGTAAEPITGRLSSGEAARVYVDSNTSAAPVGHYCVTVAYTAGGVTTWQMSDGVLSRGDCTSNNNGATTQAGADVGTWPAAS